MYNLCILCMLYDHNLIDSPHKLPDLMLCDILFCNTCNFTKLQIKDFLFYMSAFTLLTEAMLHSKWCVNENCILKSEICVEKIVLHWCHWSHDTISHCPHCVQAYPAFIKSSQISSPSISWVCPTMPGTQSGRVAPFLGSDWCS